MNMGHIREVLSYKPDEGVFIWLCDRKGGGARVGAIAGSRRPDGYVSIVVDQVKHYAHRLAWMFEVGSIPSWMEIDHIDHNPSNNRISNLRLVTKSENRHNRARDSRNKSGVNGVYWAPHAKAWSVQVRHDRKTKHIGYFKSLEDATRARKQAEIAIGFHANHGVMK